MAEEDLEVGLVVSDDKFRAGLKQAEREIDRTGKKMKDAGDAGAKAFDRTAFSLGRMAAGLRAGWELAQKLTRSSELWRESTAAVDAALGHMTDSALEKLRDLAGNWTDYWREQDAAKAKTAELAAAMADPLTAVRIRIGSLRAELKALREDVGDVIAKGAEDLSVGEDRDTASAFQQAIARKKRELYDEAVALEAFVKAAEKNRDLSEATIMNIMSSVPDILREEKQTAEERLELEERIRETRLEFLEEQRAATRELELTLRKQSWDGFLDGAAQAMEDMKDLEALGREVAAGLHASFKTQFFDFFKTRTFDAKQALASLLDLALNALSSLGASQATNLVGSIFGGFKARGGPVTAGRSYVVGEKGPEVFRPDRNGVIEPAGATPMGGGAPISIAITINQQGGQGSSRETPQATARLVREAIVHLLEHDSRFREAVQGRRG